MEGRDMVGGESACVYGIGGKVHVGAVGGWWWRETGSVRGGRGRVVSRDMVLRAQLWIELQIDRPPAAPRRGGGWPVGHGHTRGASLFYLLPGRSTAAIAGVAVS
jgi:hypothetical protein